MLQLTVTVGITRRADVFLAEHVPGWSRRTAQRALLAGAVARVASLAQAPRRLRKGDLLQGGDVLEVDSAWIGAPQALPNPDLLLPIVYEDDDVVIVDKPAGISSVSLRRSDTRTVANFLVAYDPALASVGSPLEGGLVHRLDTQTSGLLLAAKTAEAHRHLRQQLSERQVEKEYIAIVHGEVRSPGWITTAIAHDRQRRDRMRIVHDAHVGRAAHTTYKPMANHPGIWADANAGACTVLRVQIATGVMHQIRVHLASVGHPVVGDELYGSSVALSGGRHLLHASRLAFLQPRSGERVEVQSPAPEGFE